MSVYTYKEILSNAKKVKQNVKTEYKIGMSHKWSYYYAKALINPKKDIKRITINDAPKPTHTHISRQMTKTEYLNLAKTFVKFVETKKRLPNYLAWKGYKIASNLFTYTFARCLVYYDKYGTYDNEITINQKVFTKPTENPNKVYQLWVKYIKTKPKLLDDVCDYILKHFTYQFYFDDQKSNEEVIKSKKGNCTDLLQMLTNMAEALNYEWKVIHTKCRQSGTGHVYGMFRKKGKKEWFIRDIACIADESRYCIWCEVPDKGTKLAENPSWFIQNRNR